MFIRLEQFVPDPSVTLLISTSLFLTISSMLCFVCCAIASLIALVLCSVEKSLSCPSHLAVDWWLSPPETLFHVAILLSLTWEEYLEGYQWTQGCLPCYSKDGLFMLKTLYHLEYLWLLEIHAKDNFSGSWLLIFRDGNKLLQIRTF